MGNVIGDLLDIGSHILVTAGVNIAAKTFVNIDGTLPSSAAVCTGGVANADTASGDNLSVKIVPGTYAVVATGLVAKGAEVELLQGTVYGNIAGVKTAITAAGVTTLASGYKMGRALSAATAVGQIIYVLLYGNQAK